MLLNVWILLTYYGNLSITVKCAFIHTSSVNMLGTENVISWPKVLPNMSNCQKPMYLAWMHQILILQIYNTYNTVDTVSHLYQTYSYIWILIYKFQWFTTQAYHINYSVRIYKIPPSLSIRSCMATRGVDFDWCWWGLLSQKQSEATLRVITMLLIHTEVRFVNLPYNNMDIYIN